MAANNMLFSGRSPLKDTPLPPSLVMAKLVPTLMCLDNSKSKLFLKEYLLKKEVGITPFSSK